MRDRPTIDDLLETARKVLVDDLLDDLPRDKRYPALMVAAAMATAGREAAAGEAPLVAERDALEAIYHEQLPLADFNRRFADDLRAGKFDDDPEPALAILRASVRHRLAECNPSYDTGDD